jgi:predicted GIY-YIG superfamily endonuclease
MSAIYALLCPETHICRYVGYSKNPNKRYKQHCRLSENNGNTKRQNWLREVLLNGQKPVLIILEDNVTNWDEAEKRWVKYYRYYSAEMLTNTADGGYSNEHMQKAATSNRSKGKRSALAKTLSSLKMSVNKGYLPMDRYQNVLKTLRRLKQIGKYEIFARLYEEKHG